MKLRLVAFFALLPSLTFPQQTDTKPTPSAYPSTNVTRVVRIRYGIPQKIADLIITGSPVMVSADNLLRVIVLKGNPNNITSVEQTIHELDVPGAASGSYQSKNVELIVNVIDGFNNAEFMHENQISETLTPVIKQLRAVFPYKNYELLSSMLLRSSEGATAWNNGALRSLTKSGNYSVPSGYAVGYNRSTVSLEEGKAIVHLKDFMFKTTILTLAGGGNTTQATPTEVSIRTDIDLREGQKVVAGKANIGNSDLALFVVLTAKLID